MRRPAAYVGLLVAPAAVLAGTGGVLRSVEARQLLLGLLGG